MNLEGVDKINGTIDDHAITEHEKRGRGYERRLDDGDEAYKEDERGDNPPCKANLRKAAGHREVEELLERPEDEHGG